MSGRLQALDGLGIVGRANSFLHQNEFFTTDKLINFKNRKSSLQLLSIPLTESDSVAPVSPSTLEALFNQTIYNSEAPFYLIDFLMEAGRTTTEDVIQWIRRKLSLAAEYIENKFKDLVESRESKNIVEYDLLVEWLSKQDSGKKVDSDLLALRTIETLILLAVMAAELYGSQFVDLNFENSEEKLIDWSEAVGLIRSLSDDRLSLAADLSMDVDFDPSIDVSHVSTILNVKESEFEIYLLKKFKNFSIINEAVEIVADRCGIPVDSDFEDRIEKKKPSKPAFMEQTKHWRRVKPITLPIKRVTSALVTKSSSLSVSDMKSNRFMSSSSSRQVDLALKPSIEANLSVKNRRRHSESSASAHILQQTTPTKTSNRRPSSNTSHQASEINDSVVILETPPRALASKQLPQNDLTGSVRRLFPQQSMEE